MRKQGNFPLKADKLSIVGPTTRSMRCDDDPMPLMKQVLMVICGYLVIAGFELLMHWILGLRPLRALLWVYLWRTPNSGMALFPDLILPAVLLGLWNGWVGRKAPVRRAVAFVVPLAAGIVALFPLYALLVGQELIWSWPKNHIEAGLRFAILLFSTGLFVAFLTAVHHKGLVPN
jgi:hypothetical protein